MRRTLHAAAFISCCSLTAWPAVAVPTPPPLTALLRQLTLCAQPDGLAHLRMHAVETWMKGSHGDYAAQSSEIDQVLFYRGVEIELTSSRNGKPVSASRRQHQQQVLNTLKQKIDRHWSGPEDAGRMLDINGEIWTLPQIVTLYHWTELPGPVIGGVPSIRLTFTPNAGIQAGSRIQHVLLSVSGYLDVAPDTGQILDGAFASHAPVKFGLGLLARFNHLQGTFDMQPAGSTWVYHHIRVNVDGRELWTRMHGAEVMTYTVDNSPPVPVPQVAQAGGTQQK